MVQIYNLFPFILLTKLLFKQAQLSLMFLQKFKTSNQQRNFHQKQHSFNKIIDAIKKLSAPEIKHHEKQPCHLDTRRYLIQSTKKAIHLKRKSVSAASKQDREQISLLSSTKESVKKQNKTVIDLASRQGRVTAAKNFRQKIWKSSDITSLLRKQQENHLNPRKTYNSYHKEFLIYDLQRITRYQDLTPQEKKLQFQKEWFLQSSTKNNLTKSNTSNKNPEIQITNIKFKEQDINDYQIMNYSKIYNRQRKKDVKKVHLLGLAKWQRPNTTAYNNRGDKNDDIIQPW